ncbi:MAG: (Fe-S)-binding protein [candidate division Zixibacteria bacterium]|nr:(Fe-S)-binding protein [candidate division Zixibacteria bacterium]
MEGCSRCSSCKWVPLSQIKSWRFAQVCPSISRYNFHSYSGSGRLVLGLSLIDNRIDMNETFAEVAYRCTLCGACDSNCKIYRDDIDIVDVIQEIRATCVNEGQFLPEHMMLIDAMKREGNVFGEPKSVRGDWAEGISLKDINADKAEVLLHVGCRFSYDEDLREIVRGVTKLLKCAGVDFGTAGGEESCCGGRAYEIGFRGEARQFAEDVRRRVKASGAKTIVTACSDCYGTFKYLYPFVGMGLGISVKHITEFLSELIARGNLEPVEQVDMKVTYHDPCHLGRRGETYIEPWKGDKLLRPALQKRDGRMGVYDPPRNLIRILPGVELVEMERIREWSWCCGAGGGVWEAYPDFAGWSAKERIEEAQWTGTDALVTSCGWCERNFRDAAAELESKIKILDITELVALSVKG